MDTIEHTALWLVDFVGITLALSFFGVLLIADVIAVAWLLYTTKDSHD